jgi:predicted adenine nucleotide alpha hydrolase (AANH) superfamily ATPase
MRGRVHYYICTNVAGKRTHSVVRVFSTESRNMWFHRNVSSYLSNQAASHFLRQKNLIILNFLIRFILGIYIRHAKQMNWTGTGTSRCYWCYELQINCFESTERACPWMFTRSVSANCVREVDCVWNMVAHAQKPDSVVLRNGWVHLNRRGRQFSWLLADRVCASAVVMLDTPRSEVVWRLLATHSIRQFPFHFPSRASPCAITFQLDSAYHWTFIKNLLQMEQTDSNGRQLQRYKMRIFQYIKPRRNMNTRGWTLLLLRCLMVNISTIRNNIK